MEKVKLAIYEGFMFLLGLAIIVIDNWHWSIVTVVVTVVTVATFTTTWGYEYRQWLADMVAVFLTIPLPF